MVSRNDKITQIYSTQLNRYGSEIILNGVSKKALVDTINKKLYFPEPISICDTFEHNNNKHIIIDRIGEQEAVTGYKYEKCDDTLMLKRVGDGWYEVPCYVIEGASNVLRNETMTQLLAYITVKVRKNAITNMIGVANDIIRINNLLWQVIYKNDGNDEYYTINCEFESTNLTTSVITKYEDVPMPCTLTVTDSGNGTTTDNRNTNVYTNDSITLTFTPGSGYKVSSLLVNEVECKSSISNNSYTFTITGDTYIVVTYALVNTYNVSKTIVGMGAVSLSTNTVQEGETLTITAVPNEKCSLISLEINGSAVTVTNNTYTFTPTSDVEILATFTNAYTVTTLADSNCVLTCSDTSPVAENTEITFTFTPNSGYMLDTFTINGSSVTMTDNTYTTVVTGDIVAEAKSKLAPVGTTYTISFSEGELYNFGDGGLGQIQCNYIDSSNNPQTLACALEEEQSIQALADTEITFTFTDSDSGTEVYYATINGVEINTNQPYTTTVTEDISLVGVGAYSSNVKTITIDTEGCTSVMINPRHRKGTTCSFTVAPNDGFALKSATMTANSSTNNVSLTNNSYSFTVEYDATFNIVYEQLYTISCTSNVSLCQVNKSKSSAFSGESVTFTMVAAVGYEVGSLEINGAVVTLNSDNQYTMTVGTSNIEAVGTFNESTSIPPTVTLVSAPSGTAEAASASYQWYYIVPYTCKGSYKFVFSEDVTVTENSIRDEFISSWSYSNKYLSFTVRKDNPYTSNKSNKWNVTTTDGKTYVFCLTAKKNPNA